MTGIPSLTQRAVDMYRGPRGIAVYMEDGGEVESFFDRFHPLRGSYRRKKPVSVKAVEAALDFTPLGTLKTGVEIYDESQQEDPNYAKMGIMAAAEAAGYIPFAGPAIKKMVKGGLDNLDLNFNKVNQNKIFNQDVDNLIISGKELGIPTEKINKDILDYAKLKKKPHPKRAFDDPKVEYVDTKTIVDNVAQLNLPRYDVGEFGGEFPTGQMRKSQYEEFADSGKETLKENIFNEGFKQPIEIEISLSDGGVFLYEGHHRLQAAIELGIDEVPIIFRTRQNPYGTPMAQMPGTIDPSGLDLYSTYSFSDLDFKNRIRTPPESATEMRARGATVYMDVDDTLTNRLPSKYYTPMREGYYRKTEYEDGGLVLGEKTGETTTAGRDVYVAPNGDQMSEKSMTFEIDGLFVNIPSIHNGTLYSSEKIYEMFMNGEIQPTSAHRTEEEAISAAQQRSDTLLP